MIVAPLTLNPLDFGALGTGAGVLLVASVWYLRAKVEDLKDSWHATVAAIHTDIEELKKGIGMQVSFREFSQRSEDVSRNLNDIRRELDRLWETLRTMRRA
jgi:hypothetical protein